MPRAATWLLAIVVLAGSGLIWAGYELGMRAGVQEAAAAATQNVRNMLAEEQVRVEDARHETRAHLDALALRIGSLQAHLMRLDALGERLVSIGKLDAGEFDFNAEPARGDTGTGGEGQSQTAAELADGMARLAELLDDRERKLVMLEELLTSRQLLKEILPSGRPVKQGWVSSTYGKRTDPFTGKKKFHRGIDFAGKEGSEVVAVASGVVKRSEKVAALGNVVEIRHPDGYSTRYAHNKENKVKVGEVVEKGQTIALLGSTGRSNGPHVHFEVRKDGRVVNPRKFVYAK